ncbi:MAG: DUF1329 domain-containing protein [Deltaproteobacteria bacterium]|nr:DUF1329 domain-containing protein [Deltaproteobacteria bacterium]
MRIVLIWFGSLAFCFTLSFGSIAALAQNSVPMDGAIGAAASASQTSAARQDHSTASNAIPPGTTITMQNWRHYQQYMPDGMVALFEGKYFWKMPNDVSMEVGPTVIHPLPPNYLAATEKYSGQVRIVELPDGGLNLTGYQGGIPFPTPDEPHKGWKILANLWFRYIPHISVNTYSQGCYVNSFHSFSCDAGILVYRQLSYNTDPGIPATIPGAEGKFFTDYFEGTEPEQERYNADLKISYTDLTRPEDGYHFIPAYRRYQPESALARCAPGFGSDTTPEDYRAGYDSNITQVKVAFVGEKKILNLQDFTMPAEGYPHDFDLPLGWPKPSWGKWQLRDVYVINVSKLPEFARGYCYGKRVMYIDKQFYGALWENLYDSHDRLWKFLAVFRPAHQAPGIGPVDEALSYDESIWDIQNKHATFFLDPTGDNPIYLNQQAPGNYQDVERYTTPSGLNMIMR